MDIEKLKKEMKKQDLTQIELAKKAKIPLQTLRNIFSGQTKNPRIDKVEAIEKALAEGNEVQELLLKVVIFEARKQIEYYIKEKDKALFVAFMEKLKQ